MAQHTPSLLIQNLMAFNRKERFHVVAHALGLEQGTIRLDNEFKRYLREATGTRVPEFVYLATDYHLDWVYAAVHRMVETRSIGSMLKHEWPEIDVTNFAPNYEFKSRDSSPNRSILGNQEDIDLVIAFDNSDPGAGKLGSHVIFVEAKGESTWDEEQLMGKMVRLEVISKKLGPEFSRVNHLHLVLLSPGCPTAEVPRVFRSRWKADFLNNWRHLYLPFAREPSSTDKRFFQVGRRHKAGKSIWKKWRITASTSPEVPDQCGLCKTCKPQ